MIIENLIGNNFFVSVYSFECYAGNNARGHSQEHKAQQSAVLFC